MIQKQKRSLKYINKLKHLAVGYIEKIFKRDRLDSQPSTIVPSELLEDKEVNKFIKKQVKGLSKLKRKKRARRRKIIK